MLLSRIAKLDVNSVGIILLLIAALFLGFGQNQFLLTLFYGDSYDAHIVDSYRYNKNDSSSYLYGPYNGIGICNSTRRGSSDHPYVYIFKSRLGHHQFCTKVALWHGIWHDDMYPAKSYYLGTNIRVYKNFMYPEYRTVYLLYGITILINFFLLLAILFYIIHNLKTGILKKQRHDIA